MRDGLDVELQDEVTVDEIHLVTQLILVAAMAPGELEQEVIDQALGVEPGRGGFPVQRRARPPAPAPTPDE